MILTFRGTYGSLERDHEQALRRLGYNLVGHKCGPAYSCQSCHRLHCFECDVHMPGATEYKTIANRYCKSDPCAIAKQAFTKRPGISDQRLALQASLLTTTELELALAELRERRLNDRPEDLDDDLMSGRLNKLERNMVMAQGVGAFFGSFLGKYLRPQEPMPWFHLGTSDEHVPPKASE